MKSLFATVAGQKGGPKTFLCGRGRERGARTRTPSCGARAAVSSGAGGSRPRAKGAPRRPGPGLSEPASSVPGAMSGKSCGDEAWTPPPATRVSAQRPHHRATLARPVSVRLDPAALAAAQRAARLTPRARLRRSRTTARADQRETRKCSTCLRPSKGVRAWSRLCMRCDETPSSRRR